MSHKNRLSVFSVFLLLSVLLSSVGTRLVSAAPTGVPAADPVTKTPTPTKLPMETPTPGLQAGAEPEAWLDGSIDVDQFGPLEPLIIRFNTPMSPASSLSLSSV